MSCPTPNHHGSADGYKSDKAMGCNCAVFDSICFTILSLCTIGGIAVLLSIAIAVVYNLELTPLDTSVLVWLIVALCITASVLFTALYLTCCQWKAGKILLAVIYTIFDLFLLLAAVCVFALRSTVLQQIGKMWTDQKQSSIVLYFEELLNCCGFNERPAHCAEGTVSCYDRLNFYLSKYNAVIGGVLLGLFALLLVGVVISYIRAFSKPPRKEEDTKAQEMQEIQENLNIGSTVWY